MSNEVKEKGFNEIETGQLIDLIKECVDNGAINGNWYPRKLDPYPIYKKFLNKHTISFEQFEVKIKITKNNNLNVYWNVLNDLWKRSFLYDQNYRGIFAQIGEFELKLFDKNKTVEKEPLISIHTPEANDMQIVLKQQERKIKELEKIIDEKNSR